MINVIKLSKKSFNDVYIGYARNCVAFFLVLKMFLHHNMETFLPGKDDSRGYNQLHLNALYDVCNHIYQDIQIDTRLNNKKFCVL